MRKYLFFLLSIICLNIYSQRSFNCCSTIKGYRGSWYNPHGMLIQGSCDEFIIHNGRNHPSLYIFKVKIYGMSIEADKTRNYEWLE